ncbi:uncharacterized protein LOC109835760 isoform X1 [Asparagus officinalis]|uniref:uncharacterized protein LOC109835760 isoform X1 n=1 Tax=Asparagus officinalis TaxID=4686 RepID=UPI00098E4449|nr:uncharacterized protein LOC109835760 isoform X1 [Asparagus officinalis]
MRMIKVSSQEILSTSTLYRPKDILEHLTLPPKLDLEDFISNLNPSQCTMGMKVFSSSSLPPWSFSHGGTCKPVLDSCRFSLPRGGGQSKWVRIERRSTSTGDDNSRLSGLEKKTFDYYDNLANQQKVDELLQDVEVLSESVLHPFSGPQSTSESHGLHCSNLVKESGASCSLESIELEPHHEHSKNQKKDDYKDNLCDQNSESEAGLRCLGNESSLADSPKPDPLCKGNEIVQDEHPRRITDDCCRGCSGYSSRCSTRGYEQGLSRSPASDVPKQGRSSELLAAASILCEIASCSHAKKAQKDTFMRAKCAFMEKKSKYLNTSSSVERTERLFLAPRNHESFKRAAIPSSRVHKLISEQQREFTHTDNVSREPVKWFVSAEAGCASSTKLEKNHTKTNNRVLHGNSIKQSGLMPSPIKVENVYGSHLKLGKEKLKASSVIFEENSTKDRSRVKSQRG